MTRGSNERPVRRLLSSRQFNEDWAVELRADLILIRPKGSRRGGKAEVAVLPGVIYQRAMFDRISSEKREKQKMRTVRRGLLSLR